MTAATYNSIKIDGKLSVYYQTVGCFKKQRVKYGSCSVVHTVILPLTLIK